MPDKPTIEFTPDESLCVLAACVQGIANFTSTPDLDAEDRESLMQLRNAVVKMAKAAGMTLDDLARFAAMAAGRPHDVVVATVAEEDRKEGSRA